MTYHTLQIFLLILVALLACLAGFYVVLRRRHQAISRLLKDAVTANKSLTHELKLLAPYKQVVDAQAEANRIVGTAKNHATELMQRVTQEVAALKDTANAQVAVQRSGMCQRE